MEKEEEEDAPCQEMCVSMFVLYICLSVCLHV